MGLAPEGNGLRDASARLRPKLGHLRSDDEGAAAVVSILLSVLIIILLMTLATSVWMPIWMEEREAQHMKSVTAEFAALKSNIDNQILQGDSKFLIASPLELGTKGFAIFGADSSGTFSINHFREDELEFSCNVRNETGVVNITCTGGMNYNSNNRHFTDQQMAYQNGAVILHQGDGEVVRYGPQFSIEDLGSVARVSFIMISLSGPETSIRGVGSVLIQTRLVTYTSDSHRFETAEWLNISITSEFSNAWHGYFEKKLIDAGLASGADYNLTVSDGHLRLGLRNVQFFDMGYALVRVEMESNAGYGGGGASGGLVALYHLDEGSGLTARDATAYANDGTITNAVWTTGVQGSALAFDGDNDTVETPDDPSLNPKEGVTAEAWVKWAVDPSAGNPWANIINKGGEHQFQLQHSGTTPGSNPNNNYFEFAVETDTNRTWVWSTTEPVGDVWYHVVGVYSNLTEELSIYINGAKENATALNGTINEVARGLRIGCRDTGATKDRFFEGSIDEVAIYDRALTDAEIMTRYLMTRPGG